MTPSILAKLKLKVGLFYEFVCFKVHTIEYFAGLTNLEAVITLEKCIQYNLGTHCVEFRCFVSCFEQTRYMTRCPYTKIEKKIKIVLKIRDPSIHSYAKILIAQDEMTLSS